MAHFQKVIVLILLLPGSPARNRKIDPANGLFIGAVKFEQLKIPVFGIEPGPSLSVGASRIAPEMGGSPIIILIGEFVGLLGNKGVQFPIVQYTIVEVGTIGKFISIARIRVLVYNGKWVIAIKESQCFKIAAKGGGIELKWGILPINRGGRIIKQRIAQGFLITKFALPIGKGNIKIDF